MPFDTFSLLLTCWGWLLGAEGPIFEVYDKTYRSSFFTGFLTMGSLLLSVNTFVLGTVRSAYDSEEQKQTHAALSKLEPGLAYFGPLERLSDLVYKAMAAAFVTSFSQLSLGMFKTNLTALICICLAVWTFYWLAAAMLDLRATLRDFKRTLKTPDKPEESETLIGPATMSDDPYFPSGG